MKRPLGARVWALNVAIACGGACVACGSKTRLQAAHWAGDYKHFPPFRFHPVNGLLLCYRCHQVRSHLCACYAFMRFLRGLAIKVYGLAAVCDLETSCINFETLRRVNYGGTRLIKTSKASGTIRAKKRKAGRLAATRKD